MSDALFAGLKDVRRAFYKYPVKVDDLLSRSFPDPGGADAVGEVDDVVQRFQDGPEAAGRIRAHGAESSLAARHAGEAG